MVLAGLPLLGCSKDAGPMLYVDVSLSGVAAPAKVQLQVVQGQTPLATQTYTWPAGAAVLKAGIGLPKDSAGAVMVNATGFDSANAAVAGGAAQGIIGADAVPVVLVPLPAGADGGFDALPPAPDTAPSLDLAAERSPGVDGGAPDAVPPDAVPADQAGPAERGGSDTSDGSPADVAGDVAQGAEVSRPDGPGLDGDVADAPGPDGQGDLGSDGAGPQRAWSTPVQVAPDGNSNFSLAMDPVTGNAVLVWASSTEGVLASRYTAATGAWSPAVTILSDLDIYAAKAAADAQGHYLAVWSKRGDGLNATAPGLWASFSSDGTTWSKPTQLFAGGAKNFDSTEALHIAMNRKGQAMVVWDHYQSPATTGTLHTLCAVYLDGTANQTAVQLGTQAYEFDPRVGIDENANGLIAWTYQGSAQNAILAATFTKQAVASPTSLRSDSDGEVESPVVAMNAAGQGIVVWTKFISGTSGYVDELWSRRYSVTGAFAAADELVLRTGSTGALKTIVLDSYGTASVAFSRAGGPGWQATVATQDVGGTWSTQGLETDNLATSLYVNLTEAEPAQALDGNGNLLVGWRKKTSDTEYVPNLRWRTGSTWGAAVELGKVLDLFSSDMQVAAADDGRSLAVWTYYHCDPQWQYAERVCPTAKATDKMSAASRAAWGTVVASSYR
jgi:hypothetical protein